MFKIEVVGRHRYFESGQRCEDAITCHLTRAGFGATGRGNLTQGAWAGPITGHDLRTRLGAVRDMLARGDRAEVRIQTRAGCQLVWARGVCGSDRDPVTNLPTVPSEATRLIIAYLDTGEAPYLDQLSDYLGAAIGADLHD